MAGMGVPPGEIDRVRHRLARAGQLLYLNRPADALPLLYDAVEEDPDNVEALCLLARCHLQLDQPEPALHAARAAVAAAPQAEYPYRLASVGLARLGQTRPAVDVARQAVALDQQSWRTHATLALALAADKQRKAAQLTAQRVVRLAPDEPYAYATVGQVARSVGKPRQARAAFRQALRLAPLDAGLVSELASVESGLVAPIHTYATVAAVNPGDPHLAYRPEATAWFLVLLSNLVMAGVGIAAILLMGTNGRPPAPTGVRVGFVLGTWLLLAGLVLLVRRRMAGPGQAWLRLFFARPSVRVVLAGFGLSVLGLAWVPVADSHRDAWPVVGPFVGAWALSTVLMLHAGVRWDYRRMRQLGQVHWIEGVNEYSRVGALWAARSRAWTLVVFANLLVAAVLIGGLAGIGDGADTAWPRVVRVVYPVAVLAALVALCVLVYRRLTETGAAYLGRFLRRPTVVAVLVVALAALSALAALPAQRPPDPALLGLALTADLIAMVFAAIGSAIADRRHRREADERARALADPWTS